jgi:deazaflavin-dependent oxidoreductase (nitroreductase family)
MLENQESKMNRVLASLASSKPGTWFFLNVAPPIDRVLLRWSKGRISLGGTMPICLLETIGAKSGQPRSTPLMYLRDGERFVLIGSRGGNPRHPAWVHNLRKTPQATVLAMGHRHRVNTHEAEGEDRSRLWAQAREVYFGYDVYQERAGTRRIPVVVLTPVD